MALNRLNQWLQGSVRAQHRAPQEQWRRDASNHPHFLTALRRDQAPEGPASRLDAAPPKKASPGRDGRRRGVAGEERGDRFPARHHWETLRGSRRLFSILREFSAILPARYHEPPKLGKGFKNRPDVGVQAFVVPEMGGWNAGSIVSPQAIRVSLDGRGASESKAIELLKETMKRHAAAVSK